MSENPFKKDNDQPTLAGCLLLIVSLAVIGYVAFIVVRWRDPVSGLGLPRMVAIALPVLAGGVCYGIGNAILRILGLSDVVEPKKESFDIPENFDTPEKDQQTQD